VLLRMNLPREALRVLRESQAAMEARMGTEHVGAAAMLNNIGDLERRLGNYDAAEQAFQQAHKVLLASVGPRHTRATIPLLGLARIAQARGDFDGARVQLKSILKLRTELTNARHSDTLEARAALAELELEAGNLSEARRLLADTKPAPGQAKQSADALVAEAVLALVEKRPDAAQALAAARAYLGEAKDTVRDAELSVLDQLVAKQVVAADELAALPPSPCARVLTKLARMKH